MLAPDEELHAFVNDLERTVGTHLYGRRMYEVMVWWETVETAGEPDVIRDFAEIWWAADKIVYSRTLEAVASERTRIEREFEPETVRRDEGDDGARHLDRRTGAGRAGAGRRAGGRVPPVPGAPVDGRRHPGVAGRTWRLRLELLDERRFASGVVHLHYRVASEA